MKLNLGCGNKKVGGHVGVDKFLCSAVQIRADLEKPLPFKKNSIEDIKLDNVIEHIRDIPELFKKLADISKNGCKIYIKTPHFTSLSSWKDPTHRHHFSYFSFEHFTRKHVEHYIGSGIKILSKKLSFGGGILGIIGRTLFMINPEMYEKKFCFIFRAGTLKFILEIRK
jgi:SAM-dependent methyltransferase